MKTILSAAIGAMLALSAVKAGAQAKAAERKVEIAIEQQSLADALNEWAKQTGLQLVSQSSEKMNTTVAPKLKGEFTAQGALDELLKGTALTYEWVSERAVAIREKPLVVPAALQTSGVDQKQATVPVARFSGEAWGERRIAATDQGRGTGNSAPARKGEEPASDNLEDLEEIVVTGTHIRGVAPNSSPLIVFTRDDIDRSGASTVHQFMRKVPQNFALVDGETFQNNGFDDSALGNVTRGASVNIHGLGTGSTLVLLNGRRLAPSGSDGSFIDVSMIPLSAVDHVDLLTDGASALYGADAVAGVVNFVLRRDFDGAETSVRYGDSSDGGGEDVTLSQMLGGSWAGGNALIVYEYSDQAKVQASQRGFIPDQGGEFDVIPGQRRQSVLASGRHRLESGTDIFADGFYSDREFAQNTTIIGFPVNEEGGARAYGGSIGVGHDLFRDWRGELAGNYARTEELRRGVSFGTPFDARHNSEVISGDLKADGPLFSAAGGTVRGSLGVAVRRENFLSSADVSFGRTVNSAYVEFLIPFVGDLNARPGLNELELSIAGRYDNYESFGSSTDPKIGLSWSPITGLNLRGTYAKSFRVPPLAQLSPTAEYQIVAIPDVTAPDGETVTLLPADPGNPRLTPERSTSYTFGFDLKPHGEPGLNVSATYFNIDYKDRIQRPPGLIELFDIFSGSLREQVAPFVDHSPELDEIQRIFDNPNSVVIDSTGRPVPVVADDIEAFYNASLQNIATSKVRGIDLVASYAASSKVGDIDVFFAGSHLLKLDNRNAATTPVVSHIGTVYKPVDLRLRTGISWGRGSLTSSLAVNYIDEYQNNLVSPVEKIESWLTADWQLGFHAQESSSPLVRGLSVSLDVQNLTNERPPHVSQTNLFGDLGFDSTNASPRGRFVSLQVRKRW